MKTLSNAPRLKTFHAILKDRRWHSTRDIIRASSQLAAEGKGVEICAVNSTASDLRKKGFNILCRPKGRGVYEYRYTGRGA